MQRAFRVLLTLVVMLSPWFALAEETCSNPEPAQIPQASQDAQVKATLTNLSPVEADIFWDDGGYGVLVAQKVGPNGGSVVVDSFHGHTLFWTFHGRRQQLGEDIRMDSAVSQYFLPADVKTSVDEGGCVDRSRRCPIDVANNQCEINPGWMIVNCPKSCNKCDMLDPKVRCARDAPHMNMSTTPAWQPGSLDRMFQNILTDERWKKYSPTAVSAPPHGPWVLTFSNMVHDDEVGAILNTVEDKYERSTDTGASNAFGEAQKLLSTGRTSNNAWCIFDCYTNPLVQKLTHRIEEITDIPQGNYENFQVLRYEPGQFYREHHDMSPADNKLACGPRILTFFLYLSDVEEGGGTRFPRLNITVPPKKGQAVLWPSVYNHDPTKQDPRTRHEAMPVIKGEKKAANAWIHLYDYKIPNLWGCTGAFS